MRKSHLHLYGKPAQENLDPEQAAAAAGAEGENKPAATETPAGEPPAAEPAPAATSDAAVEGAVAAAGAEGAEVVNVDPEPVATEVATTLEPGTDGLEAALIMMNEGVVKAEDNEIAIENTTEVLEKLDVATEHLLPTIIQNGGLDRNGAAVLSWALEALYERVGLPATSNGLAVESFGSIMSKIEATTLSMEEVESKASEIWTKLVELWEKACEHINKLWNQFFDTATKLQARAEKVAGTAGTVKGNAKNKAITSPLGAQLSLAGKVDVKAAVVKLIEYAKGMNESMATTATEAGEMLKGLNEGKVDALKYAIPNGFAAVDPARVGMPQPADGLAIYAQKYEAPGNKVLVIVAPAEPKAATPEQLARTAARMATFDSGKKAVDGQQIPVLSPSDLAQVAKQVAELANICLSYKSAQANLDKLRKDAIAKAKEMIKAGTASDSLTSTAKGCMALASQFGPIVSSYLLTTGASAIQMVETQLKEYGLQSDAAKPAEPKAEPEAKPAEGEGKPAAEPAAAGA